MTAPHNMTAPRNMISLPHAMKEWAVVCAALRLGRQDLLFRKGGIADEDGFALRSERFWLFPTRFHQAADEVAPPHHDLLDLITPPEPNTLPLQTILTVRNVSRVESETDLDDLLRRQVLTRTPLLKRFHYREPGLWAIEVTAESLPEPLSVPDRGAYAGCHSWVDLQDPPRDPFVEA